MRWIWIDRFVEFKSGQFARAVKNLSLAEDYFADHFPGYPVMPAALMLEGLAQTGGILVGEANDYREKVILAKILQARFHGEVLAGRQLIYETDLVFLRPEGASVQGRIFAAPPPGVSSTELERVADAEIFFAHLDQARSQQIFGDHNFVFTGELKHLLGLVKATTDHKDGS
ncbi:MAG: beta-hydroxyacyl-ACP dehydratase [Planctomycetes bacterium]|nr:beta-hydroxyacyl-ACP dehydratase [Planctomycetota bacterium]